MIRFTITVVSQLPPMLFDAAELMPLRRRH